MARSCPGLLALFAAAFIGGCAEGEKLFSKESEQHFTGNSGTFHLTVPPGYTFFDAHDARNNRVQIRSQTDQKQDQPGLQVLLSGEGATVLTEAYGISVPKPDKNVFLCNTKLLRADFTDKGTLGFLITGQVRTGEPISMYALAKMPKDLAEYERIAMTLRYQSNEGDGTSTSTSTSTPK